MSEHKPLTDEELEHYRHVVDKMVSTDTRFWSEFHDAGHCWELIEFMLTEIRKLRDNQRLRAWNCPCGDLVFRDTHYDLECGTCKRVQVDADEFMLDVEIHKLRDQVESLCSGITEVNNEGVKLRRCNAKLRKALAGLIRRMEVNELIGKNDSLGKTDQVAYDAALAALGAKPEDQ